MNATLGSDVGNDSAVCECIIERRGEGKSLLVYMSEAMQLCMWTATDLKEKGNPVGHLLVAIGLEIWTARVKGSRMLRGWKVRSSTAEETPDLLGNFVELHRVLERAQALTGCELPVDQLAAALQVWLDLEEKKTLHQAA